MARSRATAKQAGTRFESIVAAHLRRSLPGGDFIERRAKMGGKDTGDLAGVRTTDGRRVVVEVKNVSRNQLAEWVAEARVEAENDHAPIGVVVHKRTGVGEKQVGRSYVTMELDDFVRLLGGEPTAAEPEDLL
jgi:hypothetical protein